jgi:uncharacterized repeat protein (TIGR01451 family)
MSCGLPGECLAGRGAVAIVDAIHSHIDRLKRAAASHASACLLVVAVLLPVPASAADTIDNTASVSYRLGGQQADPVTVSSNTVRFEVLPLPTPAELEFRRYDPTTTGGEVVPIDGGQCRIADGGFAPLPDVHDTNGAPLDPSSAQTDAAPGFYTGEPIVVTVADPNRNADPAVREYVDVDITTSTGDAETLRLQETGLDTGVFAGAIQSVPMPPDATSYDCVLSLAAFAQIKARYTDTDFPLDALAVAATGYAPLVPDETVIRLEQAVSKQVVEIGDFLQYTLVLRNIHDAPVYAARITDTLPTGLKYRAGSLRVGSPTTPGDPGATPASLGARTAGSRTMVAGGPAVIVEPVFVGNGRVFYFPVGNVAPGGSVTATFVAEVGPGTTSLQLVNEAIARASGALASNNTDTVVTMRASMMDTRLTIIGRLTEGTCGQDDVGKPVAGVRLLMEDGTFASSDAAGAYHFNGVRPGTHVVQVDPATLPPDLEVVRCRQDTRFAGRADSQFVEGQGGSLLRADFQFRRKQFVPVASEAGIALHAAAHGGSLAYDVDLDGNAANVTRMRMMVVLPDGSKYVAGSAQLDGQPIADPESTEGIVTFDLGDPGARWRRRLHFTLAADSCPAAGYSAKAMMMLDAGAQIRTPPIPIVLACGAPPGGASTSRAAVSIAAAPDSGPAASPSLASVNSHGAIATDEAADGADVDWFAGQTAGRDWLFPGDGHNPRTPTLRVVLKTLAGDKVALRINGELVDPLKFDGSLASSDRTFAVATWSGVPLKGGDNLLQAEITDRMGKPAATLTRTVHYADSVARAEFVPEKSFAVADGIQKPVIAVRMLDAQGHPVRRGVAGEYSVNAPYTPESDVALQQQRQLAGTEGSKPTWTIEGDDGIAYITLMPTGTAGRLALGFDFGASRKTSVHQDIEAWLKSAPRDWIVVGFAKGSVGYETLAKNMQGLPPDEDGKGVQGEGRVAFYAKGRVLGKWMLTLAYDSGKDTSEAGGRSSLLSTIDPNEYYTLYGDGSQQAYDASSAHKLYLKLERDQFYALFGDFQTGMDGGELTRYQRVLSGAKVEYHGKLLEATAFGAKTAQHYARDEIPGDGTSGLYRLHGRGIVLNSEKVKIETRDRYHSEQILETKTLVRHIDYDIDYDNGTLLFREPIASRDFDFNPNWIVVEYETQGSAEEFLTAGGRVGVRLMGDRLKAGVTYVSDEDARGRSQLAGVDAKFKLTAKDELRAEFAASRGEASGGAADADAADTAASGNAWIMEWEHHGELLNLLAYARRNSGAFGLGQQNATEAGMFKTGLQGRYAINNHWSLNGEVYRTEDLATHAVRDAVTANVAYQGEAWGAKAGVNIARDIGADGQVAESRLVSLGANRFLLDHKLQVSVQADFGVGGADESVDFPTRLQLGASYAINKAFRIEAAQEFTDGAQRNTSTTRLGFTATPWRNAQLTSTLNQSSISEYGPRTFALFGLDQRFVVGKQWGFDVAVDSSHTFSDTGTGVLVVDPSQPIATGGMRDGGALTEDFMAVSGGATYRAETWSWNARLEGRQGDSDRYGLTTAFLRQARDGVALSVSAQAFSQRNADGSTGMLANAQLSFAWRPGDSDWSMLDKLEFRLDDVTSGTGTSIIGQATLAANGDARSARFINNFALNYASDAWSGNDGDDGKGSVFDLYQRSQVSIYYGSKYVLDTYDGADYAGYTDILGAEARFDLTSRIDIGLRASVLHSWSQKTVAWAFGPSIGFTPFTNAWVSVGYNIRGFNDRDFESSHYTAEGAYLVFRMKFDQGTLGLDRSSAAAP